jgi:hypothetical protein
MDRLSAQIAGAEARQVQANADKTSAITGAIGGVVSTVGTMYSAGAFGGSSKPFDTSKFGGNTSKGFTPPPFSF